MDQVKFDRVISVMVMVIDERWRKSAEQEDTAKQDW